MKIEKFVHFIGVVRTGHTLVASLLDSHPNISISIKRHPFNKFIKGVSRARFFSDCLEYCLYNKNRKIGGYSYIVPDGVHNKVNKTIIVGDSATTIKTMRNLSNKKFLNDFLIFLEIPVYWIWVIRNPFESLYSACKMNNKEPSEMIELYYEIYNISHSFYINNKNTHVIYLEDFIKNPQENLIELMNFLKIDYGKYYIRACSKKIFKKPNKRFNKNFLKNNEIKKLNKLTRIIPELNRYHNGF